MQKKIKSLFFRFQSTIYKSLFLSKFCVRVTAQSKTIIFKPATPLDGEKSSSWTSNFWAKSFLPFDLYHEKSCKNGEISSRPQGHHFVAPVSAHLLNTTVVKHFCYNVLALNALPVHLLRHVFCFQFFGSVFPCLFSVCLFGGLGRPFGCHWVDFGLIWGAFGQHFADFLK